MNKLIVTIILQNSFNKFKNAKKITSSPTNLPGSQNNNNNNIPKKITIKIEVERKTIKQN